MTDRRSETAEGLLSALFVGGAVFVVLHYAYVYCWRLGFLAAALASSRALNMFVVPRPIHPLPPRAVARDLSMAIAPQRLGAALGLLAALSFGVSAPLSKLLLAELSPLLLAGLLVGRAGLVAAVARRDDALGMKRRAEERALRPPVVRGCDAHRADERGGVDVHRHKDAAEVGLFVALVVLPHSLAIDAVARGATSPSMTT